MVGARGLKGQVATAGESGTTRAPGYPPVSIRKRLGPVPTRKQQVPCQSVRVRILAEDADDSVAQPLNVRLGR